MNANTHIFLANLRHAVRNNEVVEIGGGAFTGKELSDVVAAIDAMRAALERIAAGQEMTGNFTHAETVLRYQEIARGDAAREFANNV